MTATSNFPALSTLLPINALPSDLAVIGQTATQLLAGLRYSDLVIESSPENDARYFGVTLAVQELALDLFGSGLKVIFFPSMTLGAAGSQIPISFSYRWPVLRYAPAFQTLGFPHDAKAFFDLVVQLLDISQAELVEGLIGALINDPDPEQAAYALVANWQGGVSAFGAPTLADVPVNLTPIEYLVDRAATAGVDILEIVFDAIVADSNTQQALDNVVKLANAWLGGIGQSDLEQLLLPRFALELPSLAMALEAPRPALPDHRIRSNGQS
jgi:hypothetical protein